MSRRIFLRLIEKTPTEMSSHLKLELLKEVVESIIQIKWELLPEADSRGGFKMAGTVADNVEWEMLATKLQEAGYSLVI